MEKVLIHYAEIGLKGKNRGMFENQLVRNIKESCKFQGVKLKSVKKERNIVLCEFNDKREKIVSALETVFGVKYFCFIEEVKVDVKVIVKKVGKMLDGLKDQGFDRISFKTKRSDKKFPLTSVELNTKFGEVANELGLKVDYKHAVEKIFVEITPKTCFIYSGKVPGPGGLPVGTSGKVLCLLSGGIDSPVAARQIMKRGCRVDFLHVHNLRSERDVVKSKISDIIKKLNKYQFKSKLHVVPYTIYELELMGKVPRQFDLVLFKHYLLKLAERIALKEGYKAVVTGDNLAQVASQTLENIRATSFGVSVPIFRPLLTYDKEDIIKLSERIGTYGLSIKQYKDCCSLLAKHPQTSTKLEEFKKVLEKVDVGKIIDESVKETKVMKL